MPALFRAAILALSVIFALDARAQTPPDADVQATIAGQLEAFAAGDIDAAWAFASPMIQSQFEGAVPFGAMVADGYPMVWAPQEWRFGPLQDHAGGPLQYVEITDQNGSRHILAYHMVQIGAEWRINGVQILPAPGLAT